MKRSILTLTAVALAAALTAPLQVNAAPKPSVEDPPHDANFINDQGMGDGSFGDFDQAGADASEFADLLSVTFTEDSKNLFVHIKTESTAVPSAGEGFRVRVNPSGPGGIYCLYFEVFFNGAQNDLTEWKAHLRDACAANELIEGKAVIGPDADIVITIPRKGHEALGKGKTLAAPQAHTFLWSGSYPTGVAGPFLDTTKPGSDYKLKK